MQAVHVTAHGGPEVVSLVDIEMPEPGPGEVRARVLGVSVNHLDLWVRNGMPGMPLPLPMIPGCDGCGVVDAIGEGVRLQVGQPILLEPGYNDDLTSPEVMRGEDHLAPDYKIRGEHSDGFAREYVVLPERYCTRLPEGLDPVTTAAVPLTFLTAWGMLIERARVTSSDTVLVLGATSGVGSAGIQIARHRGAQVITTASTEAGRALGLDLGAHHALDHSDPEWFKQVKSLTNGRGVDVVMEHVGPATWRASMSCLARNGRLVTCGGTTGAKVEVLLPHLFIKNLSLLGSTMGPRSAFPLILERLAAGDYRAPLDRTLPLSSVHEAQRLLEERQVLGKIVLIPGE
jgi:NADPH:quinone reductase-like Zn-dependent oxidoreductase